MVHGKLPPGRLPPNLNLTLNLIITLGPIFRGEILRGQFSGHGNECGIKNIPDFRELYFLETMRNVTCCLKVRLLTDT